MEQYLRRRSSSREQRREGEGGQGGSTRQNSTVYWNNVLSSEALAETLEVLVSPPKHSQRGAAARYAVAQG